MHIAVIPAAETRLKAAILLCEHSNSWSEHMNFGNDWLQTNHSSSSTVFYFI